MRLCLISLLFSFTIASGAAIRTGFPALNVRLTTPLTSYDSAKGSEFRCVVIAPYVVDGRVVLPLGTTVIGTVRQTKGVGLGIKRERASIQLAFHHYELSDGARYPMVGVLRQIDNARESVTDSGQIKGILAANNPQSLLHGVWHRPRLVHFSKSFIGLTGAGGKIFTSYSMGPMGAASLFAIRLALFRLPEPEIQLPAGTDMRIAIKQLPPDAPSYVAPESESVSSDLADWLSNQVIEVTKPGGEKAEDLINLAFEGSREELDNAFRSAGWFKAESLNTRTFARAYQSYTRQTGYSQAPVSRLLYRGADPDAVYQKSLNTISKRHHIRLWRVVNDGREFWLGAATHDVGVRMKKKTMSFTHKIDPRIDLERSKVANDLLFSGCAEAPRFVERPGTARAGDGSKAIVTDGDL
ncbi:MAG TPA: LssY C-terminal domain-containing protein, partial [Bryobacteraceae bacterium]|nr:LssY C-terminal domain-containing protein [Bryobacteraceae bacterium]